MSTTPFWKSFHQTHSESKDWKAKCTNFVYILNIDPRDFDGRINKLLALSVLTDKSSIRYTCLSESFHPENYIFKIQIKQLKNWKRIQNCPPYFDKFCFFLSKSFFFVIISKVFVRHSYGISVSIMIMDIFCLVWSQSGLFLIHDLPACLYTAGSTSGAGIIYPSGVSEFTPVF